MASNLHCTSERPPSWGDHDCKDGQRRDSGGLSRERDERYEIERVPCIHSNQSEYLFQLGQKHLIDASREICKEHPNNRCLARLFKHKSAKNANVKTVLINIAPNKVLVVAKTEIAPFECFPSIMPEQVLRNKVNPTKQMLIKVYQKNFWNTEEDLKKVCNSPTSEIDQLLHCFKNNCVSIYHLQDEKQKYIMFIFPLFL